MSAECLYAVNGKISASSADFLNCMRCTQSYGPSDGLGRPQDDIGRPKLSPAKFAAFSCTTPLLATST